MDFFVNKEIEALKGEIESKNIAVEASKYQFERELKNGLGDEILRELSSPSKPKATTGIKVRIARWKKRIEDRRTQKQIMEEIKKGGLV